MDPELDGATPSVPDAEAVEDLDAIQATETEEVDDTPSDSPTYTVKVNGEEISVTLDEALNGHMRHRDYTQKTQDLAQRAEELTFAEQIATALDNNPEHAIKALIEAYGVDVGLQIAEQATAEAEPSEPLDPEEQRLAHIEDFIAQANTRAFEAQVQATIAELHNDFGKFDDLQLIQFAVDHQIPDLRDAMNAMSFSRVQAVAKAKARKETAPPVAGGHGVSSGAVTPGSGERITNIGDAFEQALAAHGVA